MLQLATQQTIIIHKQMITHQIQAITLDQSQSLPAEQLVRASCL